MAEGSGKGIDANSKVDDAAALKRTATDLLQKFRQPVLVEAFLPGREFTVAITGTGDDATVLGVSEIVKKANYVGDGYGFENKEYWEDKVDIARRATVPTRRRRARSRWRHGGLCVAATAAASTYGATQMASRSFIEVNPLAGLRPEYSDMCFIATREGVSYQQLIGKIMDSFLQRLSRTRRPLVRMR